MRTCRHVSWFLLTSSFVRLLQPSRPDKSHSWLPGSRRHRNPTSQLLSPETLDPRKPLLLLLPPPGSADFTVALPSLLLLILLLLLAGWPVPCAALLLCCAAALPAQMLVMQLLAKERVCRQLCC
jgi:hypothetical protein